MATTLVIEDGTGAPDSGANSYVTVAEADTYMACRGRTEWADIASATRITHLINATYAMEATFRTLWKGKKRLSDDDPDDPTANDPLTQALAWPRKDVVDEDGAEVDRTTIPELVKTIQMEIAWHVSQGNEIVPDTVAASDRSLKREKLGPLETEYFNVGGFPVTDFPFIYQLAAPLTGGAGGARINATIGLTADELEQIEHDEKYRYDYDYRYGSLDSRHYYYF